MTHARVDFELDPRSSDQEVINVVWECTGNEQQLLSCPQTSSSRSSCTETGVYCYGKLKFVLNNIFKKAVILYNFIAIR